MQRKNSPSKVRRGRSNEAEVIRIGKELQADWLEKAAKHRNLLHEQLSTIDWAEVERSFYFALQKYLSGDPRLLIEFLRSSRPITRRDREAFAFKLENALVAKEKRGRPRNKSVNSVVLAAGAFLRAWIKENQMRSVSDYGMRGRMREESVRFARDELEPPDQLVELETVIDRMHRPKSRRN